MACTALTWPPALPLRSTGSKDAAPLFLSDAAAAGTDGADGSVSLP